MLLLTLLFLIAGAALVVAGVNIVFGAGAAFIVAGAFAIVAGLGLRNGINV